MDDIKEEFLHCNVLETATTPQEMMQRFQSFLKWKAYARGKNSAVYAGMEHRQCFDANLVFK